MDRPHSNVTLEFDSIEKWYFIPYTEAELFSPDNPLYAVIVVFPDKGDIMVYSRPGEAGSFHSIDPTHTTVDPTPPSEAFKTALAKVLTNPDESQNIPHLVDQMYPWEHHFLEALLAVLRTQPSALPPELEVVIENAVSDILDVEISEVENNVELPPNID